MTAWKWRLISLNHDNSLIDWQQFTDRLTAIHWPIDSNSLIDWQQFTDQLTWIHWPIFFFLFYRWNLRYFSWHSLPSLKSPMPTSWEAVSLNLGGPNQFWKKLLDIGLWNLVHRCKMWKKGFYSWDFFLAGCIVFEYFFFNFINFWKKIHRSQFRR